MTIRKDALADRPLLPRGPLQLLITATNAAGLRSNQQAVTFTIVR